MSFIERPEDTSVLTQQPEGKVVGVRRAGVGQPLSLPVLEELLEDGTLSTLGQNLHLQWEKSLTHRLSPLLGGRGEDTSDRDRQGVKETAAVQPALSPERMLLCDLIFLSCPVVVLLHQRLSAGAFPMHAISQEVIFK